MQALVQILLLALLAAPSLGAQQLGYGDSTIVPAFRTPADHAALDANAYGDVCIVYHTGPRSSARQVEVQIVQATAPGQWLSGPSFHSLLGDPALNVYGQGDDSCTKPAVVATTDDSFTVVWPRSSLSDSSLGRLEAARILVRDAAGALLPTPVIELASPGEGFLVDPLVPAGDAGIMPDLTAMQGGGALAVYVAEDWRNVGANGQTYREHSLRLSQINWSAGGGNPGFLEGPWTLANRIPMDNPWWSPYFGGLILPDIVSDDLDNIVVAWEQFWLVGHPGYGGGADLGEVVVRRFEALTSASPRSLLDSDHFVSGVDPEQHQRRPNLATTTADGVNDVLLSWIEIQPWPAHDQARVQVLHYPTSMATGQSSFTDGFWGADPSRDELHPTCGMLDGREIVFGARTYPQRRLLLGANDANARMYQIPAAVNWAMRPAARMISLPDGSGGFQDTLFLSYEGAAVDDFNLYRVYFGIFRI